MDMKSISQKLQDDIRAIMEAGLHPNQQKIDVHEPEKDKITAHDFKKLRTMKKTPDGKVHNCATHVEHVVLGKGTTVSEQHAEPDANGNIEWYTVQFENSVQKVLTKDLTITMSEAHMHESSEEQFDEEEKKKPVSPFDYKNYKSEIPRKPGELTGHDSKKISTGIVYTKRPVKENTDIEEARKLEGTYKHTNGHQSKVYKLSGEHNEGDPYHVKLFKGGKHYEPADYFTNDKDDAHSTAKHMVKEESHQSKTTMKHIPNASPALKKAAKDIKPGVAGYRDRIAMLKAGGVKEEAEIDEAYQTAKSEFVARQGRLTAAAAETEKDPARLKRMSNIPGYSAAMDLAKKTTQGAKHTKEEVEQKEYTFADYLEAARAQYVDEDAVLVANEAFKNQDITLFIDQSQSPEA